MRSPELKDVRLEGWLGAKMDRFISKRLVDPFMRGQIFDEARHTFGMLLLAVPPGRNSHFQEAVRIRFSGMPALLGQGGTGFRSEVRGTR